jgi:hypothetical protein
MSKNKRKADAITELKPIRVPTFPELMDHKMQKLSEQVDVLAAQNKFLKERLDNFIQLYADDRALISRNFKDANENNKRVCDAIYVTNDSVKTIATQQTLLSKILAKEK